MPERSPSEVTRILDAIRGGDEQAADQLLPLVYEQLRALARQQMAREPAGHTLQATALVHEAYLRLVGEGSVSWNSRGHFYAAAAQAMRRILVERARRVRRKRHGGGRKRITLESLAPEGQPETPADILAVDQALERLKNFDQQAHDVTMLRYFTGLTIEQTARALELTPRQVRRNWDFARLWLYQQIQEAGASGVGDG